MKIFLTGHSGMVGRNILEHPSAMLFDFLIPTSKELNLINYSEVESYLHASKIDFIIHAAGKVGGIVANMEDPLGFYLENLLMGTNILRAAKKVGVKNILNLGSSCMYPKHALNPIKEEDLLSGALEPTNEGYALAKIAVAKLAQYFMESDTSINYKTVIPCNLYGKYDKFDEKRSHMIPAAIKKIHKAKINGNSAVEIWGDGLARREFMNGNDFADFCFFAIKNFGELPAYLNVGLGRDYTITEYYNAIAKVVSFSGPFEYNKDRPVGMKQKLVDSQKVNLLGWKPNLTLEQGIEMTYKYFLREVVNE